MSSTILPVEKRAKTASNAITKLYSDNFSQVLNDTNNKLLEWLDLAEQVKALQNPPPPPPIPNALNITDQLAQNQQNVNVRKTFYENQSIQYLYNWNKLLHYLYYFFAVCLVIALFLSPNSFSIFTQIAVAIAALTYPYYSTYLVKHTMKFYSDIKTLLPKNVYTHYSDKNNYFSPISVPK
jgi:uncharacterized membrane protein